MSLEPGNTVDPHGAYRAEREGLNAAELAACESFDKHMIALASGALGLSLFYLEKVAHKPRPGTHGLIYASWILFGLTLCVMLLSFLLSQSSWRRQRELLDVEEIRRQKNEMADLVPGVAPGRVYRWFARQMARKWLVRTPFAGFVRWVGCQPNPYSVATKWLNMVSLGMFCVGVVSFVMFSIANLP